MAFSPLTERTVCFLLILLATVSGIAPLPRAVAAEKAPPRLVVVAPDSLHSALGEYVSQKGRATGYGTGLRVNLVSLEGILSKQRGADDPERLKRYLYDQWKGPGLEYVLLVGDADILPVRYMVLDRVTPAAFDYAFYPSDLYYADLAKADGTFETWNASTQGIHAVYFGEVRGEKNKSDPINFDAIHFLPEVGVGRWPVSTVEETRVVAAKTIAAENALLNGKRTGRRRAAFFAVGGWVDSRGQLDRWGDRLGSSWALEKRYYKNNPNEAGIAPDHEQVRTLFNSGLDLVVHTGHGQADQWEQCFSVKDLEKLTNGGHLPVVISAGCSTATFATLPPYQGYVDVEQQEHKGTDFGETFSSPPPPPAPYQKGKHNPTGLGEQLLKQSTNGAVAYIGCNTGSQPCALTLVEGFINGISQPNGNPARLGDAWNEAIRFYHREEGLATIAPTESWYPASIFFQPMKFMLFGDPSLRLER